MTNELGCERCAFARSRGDDELPLMATVGSSHNLKLGEKVLAIGNPCGLDHTLTTGVVSALHRSIESMTKRTIENLIQTDAAIERETPVVRC